MLGWAVSHTQSSHQGLMIREGGATVRVMACSGFESLTGDVEPRNCLGKGPERNLCLRPLPRESAPDYPISNYQ